MAKSKRRRHGRTHNKHEKDEPFHVLFCKVAFFLSVLAIMTFSCVMSYQRILRTTRLVALTTNAPPLQPIYTTLRGENYQVEMPLRIKKQIKPVSVSKEPVVNVSFADAFALAEQYAVSNEAFASTAQRLRDEFAIRYRTGARAMLQRGLRETAPHSLARRFLLHSSESSTSSDTFTIVVLGDDAASGAGNLRGQAYASVLHALLNETFQSTHRTFNVLNLAMEYASPFPLVWCLYDHYLNYTPADVYIWDFRGVAADHKLDQLEAFLRITATTKPFLILLNASPLELNLLQHYHVDALIVNDRDAVQPILNSGAPGLDQYQRFGTDSKVRLLQLLSVQNHEVIAWLIAMHFLAAMEMAETKDLVGIKVASRPTQLPDPMGLFSVRSTPYSSLFLEHSSRLRCYTSFDLTERTADMTLMRVLVAPTLSTLVASATVGSDVDLLLPKIADGSGWVLDLDTVAKRKKQLTKHNEFYGFPDWKAAYCGVAQSGLLRLILPLDDNQLNAVAPLDDSTLVGRVLTMLVLCSPKAPELNGRCSLSRDTNVTVSGFKTDLIPLSSKLVDGTDRPSCFQVIIPKQAVVDVLRTEKDNTLKHYGISVEIRVTDHKITQKKGACSISHVIYTQTEPTKMHE
jgi:hypothetical protein